MITKEELKGQISDLNNQLLMCQGALQLATKQLNAIEEKDKDKNKKVSK